MHLGCDHAGLDLKAHLTAWLTEHGYEPVDHGPFVYDALAKKCVSKKEYRAISKGQTMHKVHKILDGQKVFFGYDLGTEALEQYETCGWSQKYVTVEYGGGLPPTVTSKALKPFQGGTS